jgi:hypothetical protein
LRLASRGSDRRRPAGCPRAAEERLDLRTRGREALRSRRLVVRRPLDCDHLDSGDPHEAEDRRQVGRQEVVHHPRSGHAAARQHHRRRRFTEQPDRSTVAAHERVAAADHVIDPRLQRRRQRLIVERRADEQVIGRAELGDEHVRQRDAGRRRLAHGRAVERGDRRAVDVRHRALREVADDHSPAGVGRRPPRLHVIRQLP